MKNLKNTIIGFILGGIFFSGVSFAASETKQATLTNQINISIDGQKKSIIFANIDGTNYAKVRDIASALNANVGWDNNTQTILINTKGSDTLLKLPTQNNSNNTSSKIDISGLKYIEQDETKYVVFTDLITFCDKNEFEFGFTKLQNADGSSNIIIPYTIYGKNETKKGSLKGETKIFRFKEGICFDYDFVINTLVPFMERYK